MTDSFMSMFGPNSAFVLIGGMIGTIITTIINNRQKITEAKIKNDQKNVEVEHDEATKIRYELKVRCDKLEADNDFWKAKYYKDTTDLKDHINQLEIQMITLKSQFQDVLERAGVDEKKYK